MHLYAASLRTGLVRGPAVAAAVRRVLPLMRPTSAGAAARGAATTNSAAAPASATASASSSILPPLAPHQEVTNQSVPLENYNMFRNDAPLLSALEDAGALDWAREHLDHVGGLAGSAEFNELAAQANKHRPALQTHDRFGRRVDVVDFHPAYHEVMRLGIAYQIPSYAWNNPDKPGAQAARSALGYMMYQTESGTQCPQTMTYACVPALRFMRPEDKAICDWEAKAICPVYDPRNVPATEKEGVTIGMSMTERQGGSDVRANTTKATPCDPAARGNGAGYFLNGHKWFTSAPMCDAFLTLAYTEEGLSCFIVPRWIPQTGERNRGLAFLRLKDKLGDHSNASSEIEYRDAWGQMLGEPGQGIATILQMVHHTRLDCLVGSAGLIRRCVSEAAHHVANRSAFGTRLSDAPMMQSVIADLEVEAEAATLMAFRIARTFGDNVSEEERAFARLATPISKYFICKRAPAVAYEAMECHGGNGYIEDSIMPRLYRQSPLNAIWEGSGNVICLDVFRAMAKEPRSVEAFMSEVLLAKGMDSRLDAVVGKVQGMLQAGRDFPQGQARSLVGLMAVALQGSLMVHSGHPAAAEIFCASRLSPTHRSFFGCIESTAAVQELVTRATPTLTPQ